MAGFKKAGSMGGSSGSSHIPSGGGHMPAGGGFASSGGSRMPYGEGHVPAGGRGSAPLGGSFTPPVGGYSGGAVSASLIIIGKPNEPVKAVALNSGMTIGRKPDGLSEFIQLDSKIVSRNHGMFTSAGGQLCYTDMGSTNGTYINERLLMKVKDSEMSETVRLHDGDIIRIDRREFNKPHPEAITMIFSETFDNESEWISNPITSGFSVQIGRGAGGGAAVGSGGAAAIAQIYENSGRVYIHHSDTRFPVLINNKPVTDIQELFERTVIKISDTLIFVLDGKLVYNARVIRERGLVVDLRETAVMEHGRKKSLLRDVHIEINKGDFVLILGGSGAGKSTLVNSILGKYDINGDVRVFGGGGSNSIAYVPQTLTIRKNERLIDVVTDTAILRMNGHMSKADRSRFIMDTLASFGLAEKASMQIKNLSGGEQRRASIANEVVTNPDIFFLDEPDSGLDPRSGMELMMHLKGLAAKGKIVMLISHNYASYSNPENIYGKVIVLAKSDTEKVGQLAFLGTIPQALEFFGVEALRDITKLINPRSENGDGRADEFIAKFRGYR